MSSPYIVTRSGQRLYFWAPEAYRFDVREIAYGLARTLRFTGHTSAPYSVAAHSVWCARSVIRNMHWLPSGARSRLALLCLLHDAHEAYIGDLATPLATAISPNRIHRLKRGLQGHILQQLDVAPPSVWEQRLVACWDQRALTTEARAFFPAGAFTLEGKPGLAPLRVGRTGWLAQRRFLRLYERLKGTGA